MGQVTCAEAAAKTQLLGADPQLHVHPSAAQAEDHQLQVLLNASDGFAFQGANGSGVCPNAPGPISAKRSTNSTP